MIDLESTLQSGEKIITKAKLSNAALIVPGVFLLIGIAFLLLASQAAAGWLRWLAILVIIVAGYMLVQAAIQRFTTQLYLTNQRFVGNYGFGKKHTMDAMLNKIDRIEVMYSMAGRVLGYGTIVVRLAGGGRVREHFSYIVHADSIASQARKQADMARKPIH